MVPLRMRTTGIAAGLAVVLTLGAGLPTALAGPDDDRRRIDNQLTGARADLDESSAQLRTAAAALTEAQAQLRTARTGLATVRGQVAAARAKDVATAAALASAQATADKARADATRAHQRLRAQRGRIVAFANATYQGAAVAGLTSLVTSSSPADLLGRAHIVASVTESQRTAFTRLDAARADVAAHRAASDRAEAEVERQRRAAAANLARLRTLERQRRAAAATVTRLVKDRQAAMAGAERARKDDLRRYRALVAERERIQRLLEELARRDRHKGGVVGGLSRPVHAPITSPYGMRFHPILHRWKLHDGTDFGASCGTPVRAAAPGRVVSRYYNAGYGNRVLVGHGWLKGASIVTAYNHLSGYAVRSGEHVDRGEIVGYVGTTGYSTGCHLHFMVYRNGSTVDPMRYL